LTISLRSFVVIACGHTLAIGATSVRSASVSACGSRPLIQRRTRRGSIIRTSQLFTIGIPFVLASMTARTMKRLTSAGSRVPRMGPVKRRLFFPAAGVLDGELVECLVDARQLLLELHHVGIALGSPRTLLERVEGAVLGPLSDHAQLVGLDSPAPADLGVGRVLSRHL